MQVRYSDENSVRLSVHQMCGYCDKREEKCVQFCIPYETSFSLVFSEEKMVGVGRPLPTEILGSTGPCWSEMADFEPITAHSASAVAKQVQEVHYTLSNEPKMIIVRCP